MFDLSLCNFFFKLKNMLYIIFLCSIIFISNSESGLKCCVDCLQSDKIENIIIDLNILCYILILVFPNDVLR